MIHELPDPRHDPLLLGGWWKWQKEPTDRLDVDVGRGGAANVGARLAEAEGGVEKPTEILGLDAVGAPELHHPLAEAEVDIGGNDSSDSESAAFAGVHDVTGGRPQPRRPFLKGHFVNEPSLVDENSAGLDIGRANRWVAVLGIPRRLVEAVDDMRAHALQMDPPPCRWDVVRDHRTIDRCSRRRAGPDCFEQFIR